MAFSLATASGRTFVQDGCLLESAELVGEGWIVSAAFRFEGFFPFFSSGARRQVAARTHTRTHWGPVVSGLRDEIFFSP
jgi:hypothetical protein